jgi:hypothetical protein
MSNHPDSIPAQGRMKPGPFRALLDEAKRFGIDTQGVTNDRGSAERLQQRITDKKSAGTRPQMVAGKRTINMAGIPTFQADARTEQLAREVAHYLMVRVDWVASGSVAANEPKVPDLLSGHADAVMLRGRVHLMADEIVRLRNTQERLKR